MPPAASLGCVASVLFSRTTQRSPILHNSAQNPAQASPSHSPPTSSPQRITHRMWELSTGHTKPESIVASTHYLPGVAVWAVLSAATSNYVLNPRLLATRSGRWELVLFDGL
jgi:hypothetical protein